MKYLGNYPKKIHFLNIRENTVIFWVNMSMNENQLNIVMDCISDPIKNVYRADSFKEKEEIRRMCRVFAINNEQTSKNKLLSVASLSTIKIVLSYN